MTLWLIAGCCCSNFNADQSIFRDLNKLIRTKYFYWVQCARLLLSPMELSWCIILHCLTEQWEMNQKAPNKYVAESACLHFDVFHSNHFHSNISIWLSASIIFLIIVSHWQQLPSEKVSVIILAGKQNDWLEWIIHRTKEIFSNWTRDESKWWRRANLVIEIANHQIIWQKDCGLMPLDPSIIWPKALFRVLRTGWETRSDYEIYYQIIWVKQKRMEDDVDVISATSLTGAGDVQIRERKERRR